MKQSLRVSSAYWGQSASEEFLGAIVDFVERHGTIRGLVVRMEAIGLHSMVRSWLFSSAHEPIRSDQLHALFGTDVLRGFAAKMNLSPRDVVRHLSQALPRILNRLAAAELRWERLS